MVPVAGGDGHAVEVRDMRRDPVRGGYLLEAQVKHIGADVGAVHDLGCGVSIEDVTEGRLILRLTTRALLDLGDGFFPMGLRNRNMAESADDLFLNRRATEISPATGACSYWMPLLAVGLVFRL